MKKTFLFTLLLTMFLAFAVNAYPISGSMYDPDEIIYLPVPPNPEYTNYTSGSIDAMAYTSDTPFDYTIVVQNEFDLNRWKEFLYRLTNIVYSDNGAAMDFHLDFSSTNPAWLENPAEPMLICEAYWNIFIGGTGGLMPPTWEVVGYPGNNPLAPVSPVMQWASNPNDIFDLMLPPYDGTRYYDWNPEWVSLSFYGYGFSLDYEFVDWCIPEPAALSLLTLGALAMLRRRK